MRQGFCIFQLLGGLILALAMLLGLVATSGCVPQDRTIGTAALPSEFQPIAGAIVDAIKEQGVLNDWLAKARARGIRPGIETHFTSDNSVGVRFSGIAVEGEGEATGEGYANVPGEIMAFILDRAKAGDEEASALLRTWFEGRAAWKPGPARGGNTTSGG